MKFRSFLGRPFAKYIRAQQRKWSMEPVKTQKAVLESLLKAGEETEFGKEHKLAEVHNHKEYVDAVPLRDYEGIKGYIERIIEGQSSILWPGKPAYFAKTSGTTSGSKYIPITKDSIPNHINSARNALLTYIGETGKADFIDGKLIFLSGSPVLDSTGGIPTGRLSGMVNHHVPAYLRSNQLPSYETNCIEDWEEKLERIIDETLSQNMTLISGIPPWMQMYFDRIIERTDKPISEVFQQLSLLVHGGVNFEPYKNKLFESIGRHVDSIETYPASEGFIAYQDTQDDEGLLILLDSGIFFEFVPTAQYFDENPPRLTIGEVEMGINYAVIINSNAGLWGYSLGDSVKFVSLNPHKIVVTGRIKHFISAFGEHVIGEEVEKAMHQALQKFPEAQIVEFTVAPNITPPMGLPHHEWYIEFADEPANLEAFEKELNLHLQKLNSYYDDLMAGNILTILRVIRMKKGAFRAYMKSQGKLGGQNKVPRLSNDRILADKLQAYSRST